MVESVMSGTISKAMDSNQTLVVLLPARNEETTAGQVVQGIPRTIGSWRVIPLVVDDGSDDRTARVSRDAGALMSS